MSQFKIPESLDELDVDGLLDLRAEAKKAASELVKDETPTDEQLAEAEAIVEFIDKADARIAEVRAAEAERQATIDRLRAASAEDEQEDETPEDSTEETPEDTKDETPAEEVVENQPEAVAEDINEEEKVPVAASAGSAVDRATDNAPEVEAPKALNRGLIPITASADVPNVAAGKSLEDLGEVAKVAQARLSAYPKNRIGGKAGTRMRNGIATFNVAEARTDGLYQGNPDYKDDQALVMAATKEGRLTGGSLTAAGGWCAPSETLYDFCVEESTDGIISLPSVTANRGSVRWTKGPDFSTIYANADGDWHLTEAEVIADTVKPCIEVECAPFTETTLDVTGVCVSAGILTNAAYPELVRRYIEAVLIAHEHKVGGRIYAAIDAASTALTMTGAVAAFDALTHLEIAIDHMRERKRLPMNQAMEVLAPHWYKAVVRGDLARRNGVDLINVSDQMIQSYFAMRGASVQWLYNTGQDIDEAAGTITVPATVDLLVYPSGSFVKLTTDLLTLDGIYDSTNLSTNTYTALFTEEGYTVLNPCGDAYKVTVPTTVTGQTGAADQTASVLTATV